MYIISFLVNNLALKLINKPYQLCCLVPLWLLLKISGLAL